MSKEISAEFPFESKFLEVKGSKIHYIDEGEGDHILFLHGNPTSSYLWRNVIPYMTSLGRCIALDHIGMGKSDKPDIKYGFTSTSQYLEEFIEKLGLQNITLVIHDWGSIMGFHYANTHRDKIKAIAFMEGLIHEPRLETMPMSVRIGMTMMRSKLFGPLMVKRFNIFITKMLPDLINRKLTKEEMDYYAAPYTTYDSREPLLAWPMDVPFKGRPEESAIKVENYSKWLKENDLPKLCLYVTPGVGFQAPELEIVKNEFKNTRIKHLGEGLHFIQEDYPHEIGEEIAKWYQDINN
jgi:haloalkane dehalogenase